MIHSGTAVKTRPPASEKLQVIDLLRTFSILSVMATHFVYVPPPDSSYQLLWRQLQKNGAYGVGIFFVVSGFLITRLIDGGKGRLFKPRLKEFYVRRLARIFPLFFLVVLLGIFVTFLLPGKMLHFNYCFWANPRQFDFLFWLSLFSFSFNWYMALSPNNLIALAWAVMWSLSVEEQFYFFYPRLLKMLGNQKRLLFILLIFIGGGPLWRLAAVLGAPQNPGLAKFASFGAFDQIAFGALLYLAAGKYKKFLSIHPVICLLACLSGVFLLVGTYASTNYMEHPADLVWGESLVALGSFLFLLGGLHLPLFESKLLAPLSWPGKYSYGNYLLHAFVFYYAYPLLVFHGDTLSAYFLFIVISTAVSALSFRFFEVPANRMVRGIFGFSPA
ncbi:MAG TPA: acyltransferase [bacterium]|nr:acyltransferase [bacterium]